MGFIDLNFAPSIVARSQLRLAPRWTPAAALYCWSTLSCKNRTIRAIDITLSYHSLNPR